MRWKLTNAYICGIYILGVISMTSSFVLVQNTMGDMLILIINLLRLNLVHFD